MPILHLAARAYAFPIPLYAHESASWLWPRLESAFPEALGATLMDDHMHVVTPTVAPDQARAKLARLLGNMSRATGPVSAFRWQPVPEPTVIADRQKLARPALRGAQPGASGPRRGSARLAVVDAQGRDGRGDLSVGPDWAGRFGAGTVRSRLSIVLAPLRVIGSLCPRRRLPRAAERVGHSAIAGASGVDRRRRRFGDARRRSGHQAAIEHPRPVPLPRMDGRLGLAGPARRGLRNHPARRAQERPTNRRAPGGGRAPLFGRRALAHAIDARSFRKAELRWHIPRVSVRGVPLLGTHTFRARASERSCSARDRHS